MECQTFNSITYHGVSKTLWKVKDSIFFGCYECDNFCSVVMQLDEVFGYAAWWSCLAFCFRKFFGLHLEEVISAWRLMKSSDCSLMKSPTSSLMKFYDSCSLMKFFGLLLWEELFGFLLVKSSSSCIFYTSSSHLQLSKSSTLEALRDFQKFDTIWILYLALNPDPFESYKWEIPLSI